MVMKMYSALSAKDRQKLFEDLVETSHDLIWQCDHEGRFTYLNPAWETVVGFTRHEMLGRTFSEFQPHETAGPQSEAFTRMQAGEALKDFRTAFIAKSGETVHFLLNSKTIYNDQGHFLGARGTVQDITERLRAESAVKESEGRFRSVLDNSLDVIYRINVQTGLYDYLSPSVETVLTYSPDELMKMDAKDSLGLIHPDDLPGLMAAFEQLEKASIAHVDYRLRTKSGAYRWLSNSMSLVRDDAGSPLYREGNIRDISERKQAEEALRRSEQRLKFHLENSPLAVVEWDNDFIVMQWSAEAERMFGWKKEETIGKRIDSLKIIYDEDLPLVERTMQRLLGGQERTVVTSNRNCTNTGEVIECVWYNSVLLDGNGRMSSVLSLVQDVTQQKRDHQALLQSEQRANAILNVASESMWLMDLDGEILAANRIAAARLGVHVADVVGKNFNDMLSPALAAKRRAKIDEMVACGRPIYFSDERDGISFDHTFYPVKDTDGRITAFAIFSRDMTETRRIASALEESENRFHTMINAISQLAWMARPDGYIYWYNDRWYEYTGAVPEDMEGWGWEKVHDPSMLPLVRDRWKESIATGAPFEMEFPLKGADGLYRPFLTRVMPVKDSQGNVVQWFGTNTDITERKKNELELRQLYEQANRHAIVKTQLLNEVNHRVKNNLMVILGLILVEKRQAMADGHHNVEAMAVKLEGRIKGLLAVHQMLSDSRWEPISLTELAQSICKSVLSSGGNGDRMIDLDVEHSNIEVTSRQAGSLALVFNELTVNCMKHAFGNGGRPSITIRCGMEEKRLRIAFKDNGCGYPETVLANKQWSVGLRLIHQLIEQTLGGQVLLLNQKGAVTVMYFDDADRLGPEAN